MYTGILAGLIAGVLSGLGIGGGTLLIIYLTAFAGVDQSAAQGINLLYFLPCSAAALTGHIRNRLVDWKTVLPAVMAGVMTGAAAAFFTTGLDMGILQKLFGGFLLIIGGYELFSSPKSGKSRS
jgi:uncharacterized membrane protein YfcA